MKAILIAIYTLVESCLAAQFSVRGFERLMGVDGVFNPQYFETMILTGETSESICSAKCVRNGCVAFVHNKGRKTCYFYDRPIVASNPSNVFGENSVAFIVKHDVLKPGEQLYHYIPGKKEAWIITLTAQKTSASFSRHDAKDDCAGKGGELLPLHGTDEYVRFNALDAAYPGLLRTINNCDCYWVGPNEIQVGNDWRNIDGSAASLMWHQHEPNEDGDCGILFHCTGLADKSFKFGDNNCDDAWRQICYYKL